MRRCYGCFELIKDELEVCPFCGYVKDAPAKEAVDMNPGTILAARYIIGMELGSGGFGVTYLGWDSTLEIKVAIKEYMPSEFSTRVPGQTAISVMSGSKSEQFTAGMDKFVDEAKRLSKFQKEDGIVKVFDCITENGTAYIIMEYLEGETLRERLKREKRIDEEESLKLMMPVLKSLVVVHEAGIIHRDISPDNIYITKDGRVKLIDFGAARYNIAARSKSLTVIIKPGYSPEEQYREDSEMGPHNDVYSAAATLYKMITGETPPDALERQVKLENTKKEILVEPHKIVKNISLVTENAMLNALNIHAEDRTPTIKQFIDDLTAEEPVKRVYGKVKVIDFYRMPFWLKTTLTSLLIVIIGLGILLAMGVIDYKSLFKTEVEVPEGYTIVPNIEGMDIDSAIAALQAGNLDYITGGNVVSDYLDANLIVYQTPEAGKIVSLGSVVVITISRGSNDVILPVNGVSTVPVFLWSEEADAINDFTIAGLDATVEYIYDDNVAAGQVIRVTDDNGTILNSGDEIPEGSSVILVVSLGSESDGSVETEPSVQTVTATPTVAARTATSTPTSAPTSTPTSAPSSSNSTATSTPTPTVAPVVNNVVDQDSQENTEPSHVVDETDVTVPYQESSNDTDDPTYHTEVADEEPVIEESTVEPDDAVDVDEEPDVTEDIDYTPETYIADD